MECAARFVARFTGEPRAHLTYTSGEVPARGSFKTMADIPLASQASGGIPDVLSAAQAFRASIRSCEAVCVDSSGVNVSPARIWFKSLEALDITGTAAVAAQRGCAVVLEYGFVVSIPAVKLHIHTGVTLGVTNMGGFR
jgi:hypothetical protein